MHIEIVKDYYGNVLRTSDDLKTKACCTPDNMPERIKVLLANIHDEVLAKYYGCGLVVPELLEGRRVLDLGCGSGRDVYALAQLVGADGRGRRCRHDARAARDGTLPCGLAHGALSPRQSQCALPPGLYRGACSARSRAG
ncbi:MAG: hypothetical protein M5U16_04275 [Hyphomicrobium sp.]|nr:hypothetical protein [Hyphomicrobium sp.]